MDSANFALPAEISLEIAYLATGEPRRKAAVPPRPTQPLDSLKSPYDTPPATCLLTTKVPAELRREIFGYCLPGRQIVYHPVCNDDVESKPAGMTKRRKHRRSRLASSEKEAAIPRPVTDLIVLNKQICRDVTSMLYEERWFVIHVHEGLTDGGVEFLQAGRQPLQLASGVYDQRFEKFTRNSQFGFDRIKKIRIQIHPAQDIDCRHTAINTYFINLALCRLLQRGQKDSITHIVIEFAKSKVKADEQQQAGRRAIQRAEQYWWDPDEEQPRVTSVHNVPNIELVLYPFANLSGCHNVEIELPPNLAQHGRTKEFTKKLCASMVSKQPTIFMDDDLEMNIEKAQSAMEDYVAFLLTGKKPPVMDRMTEVEMTEGGFAKNGADKIIFGKEMVEDGIFPDQRAEQSIKAENWSAADLQHFGRDRQVTRILKGLSEGEQVFAASAIDEANRHEDVMDSRQVEEFQSFDAGDEDDDDELWFGRDEVKANGTGTAEMGAQAMRKDASQGYTAFARAVDAPSGFDEDNGGQQTQMVWSSPGPTQGSSWMYYGQGRRLG